MGYCDVSPYKVKFLKVGKETILIEYYDSLNDSDHYGCVLIYKLDEEGKIIYCHDPELKEQMEKAKQLGKWQNQLPLVIDLLNFKQTIRKCLENVLYDNFSLDELSETKMKKIVSSFIKRLKE